MKKLTSLTLLALVPAFAQQPKFALADVHNSKTAYWFAQNTRPVLRDGLLIYRDANMLNLIQAAYDVTEDGIGGGPSWLKSDLFDVVAKVPDGATLASVRPMLQALLAERFALQVRQETHPAPRYVLSVGKSGSKLRHAAVPTGDSGCKQEMAAPLRNEQTGAAIIPNVKATCRNMTTRQLADTLRQMAGGYTTYLDHEVVDATKLEGPWDFEMEWTMPQAVPEKGRDSITIFDAVSKQLGLQLDLKEVSVPLLVVVNVQRKPAPNPPGVEAALALGAPQFEVAIVKPADLSRPVFTGLRYTGGSQLNAGGTLRSLMALAFQIQPNAANDVLIGLPKSADSQVWDITAKFPNVGEGAPLAVSERSQPPPYSVVLEMLRGLLAEHFQLKTHIENRETTVYALTAVNGKLKLTKAADSERSDCKPAPNAPKPFPNLGTMVDCRNITMAEFARNLEQATGFFDHPIVDATGLEGGWSFFLGWSRARGPQAPNPNQPAAAIPDSPDDYMSSYDAVERQLGLKLVKQKRSIPVVVVDHVSEQLVE
ncbi:MAG: TIGR03435 family protein [Acidobacteriota bacterium]